ncbi:unnamed protein product [Caenorhabditis nigoni]
MVIVQVPPGLALLIILPIFMFHMIETKTLTSENAVALMMENVAEPVGFKSSTSSPSNNAAINSDSPSSGTSAPSTPSSPASTAPEVVLEYFADYKMRSDHKILKLCAFNTTEDVEREMKRYKKDFMSFHPTAALNQQADRRDRNVRKCMDSRNKKIEDYCGTTDCEERFWGLYWTTIANTCTKYNEDQCLTKERIRLLCCPEQKD